MTNFVLAYRGGGMAETEEAQQAAMNAWMSWFGELADAVVDIGNPFGGAVTVAPDGSTTEGGAAALTGYSIITADGIQAAAALAKGCPVLAAGGSVEVYEAVPVM